MNFMRELYNAILSGSHYKRALFHEGKSSTGKNPKTLECLARAYARVGNLKEALAAAEESYGLYKALNTNNNLIEQSIIRVERFISALKSENMDNINKTLTV
jgi:predicted Zn-dependent protease